MNDEILKDSRLTPSNNGSIEEENTVTPTEGQKWWYALIVTMLFFIISSPIAYNITTFLSKLLGGMSTHENVVGLSLHSLIFLVIFRFLLW